MTDILITSDHITRWRQRCQIIDAETEALMNEKTRLQKRLEAADFLIRDIASEPEIKTLTSPELRTRGERPDRKTNTTFPAEIERIVRSEGGPLSYDDLKREIGKGPLATKLKESDKGFYHAISRLIGRGAIVKQSGWVFSPEGLKLYSLRETLGVVKKLPHARPESRRSPMGEAILAFVIARPSGVKSRDIVKHLKNIAEFRDTLERNATGGYNVIARLAKRGEIRKEGRIVYPPKEQEPPEGGSDPVTGGTTLPLEQSEREQHGDPFSQHC